MLRKPCCLAGLGLGLFLVWLGVMPSAAAAAFPGRNGLLAVTQGSGSGLVLVSMSGRVERRLCVAADPCGGIGAAGGFSFVSSIRPAWSRDGRTLAVGVDFDTRGGGYATAFIYPDGTCLNCQLRGELSGPGFTPAPTAVSVVDGLGRLVDEGIDGLVGRVLIPAPRNPPQKWLSGPVWSIRGELAVVRSSPGLSYNASTIWVGRPGKLHRFASGDAPSWSPDGSRIVFVSGRWLMIGSVAGRSVRRLVRGSAPAWSPDGRWIAFIGHGSRLSIVRVNGGRARHVGTVTGTAVDWQPLPAKPARSCLTPPGSKLIKRSGNALVTARSGTGGTAYLGCLLAGGQTRLLSSVGPPSSEVKVGVGPIALAGDYAALSNYSLNLHDGSSSSEVAVFDLKTGLAVPGRGGELAGCAVDTGCQSTIDQLVLGADAVSATHITDIESNCSCTTESIKASDSTGVHTLDSVTRSDTSPPALTNLSLTGDTLTWEHNGTPRSAQLQP